MQVHDWHGDESHYRDKKLGDPCHAQEVQVPNKFVVDFKLLLVFAVFEKH